MARLLADPSAPPRNALMSGLLPAPLASQHPNALAGLLMSSPPSRPLSALTANQIADIIYSTPRPQLSAGASQFAGLFTPRSRQ